MIKITRTGFYKLIETKSQTKILYLDNDIYAWVESEVYGEMLVTSHRTHKTDCVLAIGHFSIFDVEDEPNIADITHLELEVGGGAWQGYVLPNGLPDSHKLRCKIIPTHEIISGNPRYKKRPEIYQTLARSKNTEN